MKKERQCRNEPGDGPPTLPLPPTWRLVVAAIVILGVLYMMYEAGREAEEPPPASSANDVGTG